MKLNKLQYLYLVCSTELECKLDLDQEVLDSLPDDLQIMYADEVDDEIFWDKLYEYLESQLCALEDEIISVDIDKGVVTKQMIFKYGTEYYEYIYIEANSCWSFSEMWNAKINDSEVRRVYPYKIITTAYSYKPTLDEVE